MWRNFVIFSLSVYLRQMSVPHPKPRACCVMQTDIMEPVTQSTSTNRDRLLGKGGVPSSGRMRECAREDEGVAAAKGVCRLRWRRRLARLARLALSGVTTCQTSESKDLALVAMRLRVAMSLTARVSVTQSIARIASSPVVRRDMRSSRASTPR